MRGWRTYGKLGDADPVAEGDGGGLRQVAPGLQHARPRVGAAVAHALHQRRQQVVLAAQPRLCACMHPEAGLRWKLPSALPGKTGSWGLHPRNAGPPMRDMQEPAARERPHASAQP